MTNTLKDVTIKAVSNGEVIFSRKKKVAVPGEMETILLPYDKFSCLNDDIIVALEVE